MPRSSTAPKTIKATPLRKSACQAAKEPVPAVYQHQGSAVDKACEVVAEEEEESSSDDEVVDENGEGEDESEEGDHDAGEKEVNEETDDSDGSEAVASKLLEARIKAMEKEKGNPTAPLATPQPVINVVLPSNLYGLGTSQDVNGPAPATIPAATPSGLIPSGYQEGPDLDITTFCAIYNLPPTILEKFHCGAITGTHAFADLTAAKLGAQPMDFKIGEVIDLKRAIKAWANHQGSSLNSGFF
ncbi:hypothetical protein BJ165DRAFT_1404180 [Panaeolus papilionaceus]|nr:hypothetical protein BJ165DRAFT_1404180 [Panaeolus papilionaceus]